MCCYDGERAFDRNTFLVMSITVASKVDGALFDALVAALPSNSTLRELSFGFNPSDDDSSAHVGWSPVCLAMRRNKGAQDPES